MNKKLTRKQIFPFLLFAGVKNERIVLVHSITLIFCFSMRDDDEQTYLLLLCEYHIQYHSTTFIHSKTPLSNIRKYDCSRMEQTKKYSP